MAGIDVGLKHHVVIREAKPSTTPQPFQQKPADFVARLWFAGEVDFDALPSLLTRYNVSCVVIDSQPERHKATEFVAEARCNVYLAYYGRHDPGYEVVSGRPPMIRANRLELMDQVVDRTRKREVALPREARQLGGRMKDGFSEYYREMMAPQRLPIRDSNGNFDYRWDEKGRDDHYFHAEVYALLAELVKNRNRIEALEDWGLRSSRRAAWY